MKKAVGLSTQRLTLAILLVLLSGAFILNLLLPQNMITYAVLGMLVLATVNQLKKINVKL